MIEIVDQLDAYDPFASEVMSTQLINILSMHSMPTIIILDKWDNRNIHPPLQQNVDRTHREIEKELNYITYSHSE